MPRESAIATLARLRALAAIAFLAALGILTAGSLLASGESSQARPEYAPPAAHDGPIDPNC